MSRMAMRDFQMLPVIEDLRQHTLKVGDKFLTGGTFGLQKDNKEIGQSVSYYEVVAIHPRTGVVSYAPRYAKLTRMEEE